MDVYRLANARRADDLTGTGARLTGGRWNSIGTSVLYTATSRSLAALDVLVHSPVSFIPDHYQMLTIRVPDDSLLSVPLNELPDGWNGPIPPLALKAITEQWLLDSRFLLLKVPSAVVQGEYNFLINPVHSRMAEVAITTKELFRFDSRLGKE